MKKKYYLITNKQTKQPIKIAIKWESKSEEHFVPIIFDNKEEALKFLRGMEEHMEIKIIVLKDYNKVRYYG